MLLTRSILYVLAVRAFEDISLKQSTTVTVCAPRLAVLRDTSSTRFAGLVASHGHLLRACAVLEQNTVDFQRCTLATGLRTRSDAGGYAQCLGGIRCCPGGLAAGTRRRWYCRHVSEMPEMLIPNKEKWCATLQSNSA